MSARMKEEEKECVGPLTRKDLLCGADDGGGDTAAWLISFSVVGSIPHFASGGHQFIWKKVPHSASHAASHYLFVLVAPTLSHDSIHSIR